MSKNQVFYDLLRISHEGGKEVYTVLTKDHGLVRIDLAKAVEALDLWRDTITPEYIYTNCQVNL